MDDPLGGTADPVARLRDKSLMLQHPERERIAAEIERLTETDRLREAAFECYVDEQRKDRAEIERLRTQCGGNCRYWEGRWRDEWAENERLKARIAELEQRATDGEIQAAVRAALGGKNPWNA